MTGSRTDPRPSFVSPPNPSDSNSSFRIAFASFHPWRSIFSVPSPFELSYSRLTTAFCIFLSFFLLFSAGYPSSFPVRFGPPRPHFSFFFFLSSRFINSTTAARAAYVHFSTLTDAIFFLLPPPSSFAYSNDRSRPLPTFFRSFAHILIRSVLSSNDSAFLRSTPPNCFDLRANQASHQATQPSKSPSKSPSEPSRHQAHRLSQTSIKIRP